MAAGRLTTAKKAGKLANLEKIKNPDALATRAAQALTSELTIAMTGTPVENRLEELWSILSVTNSGLLGTRSRFRQRSATPIEQRHSRSAAGRLNALVADLYRSSVTEAFDAGLGAGIERRGRVLALLTRLKQICNHPAQGRPDAGPLAGRSGKFDRVCKRPPLPTNLISIR